MKKILLATTALVLSGGMAAAQGLSIGGMGRMGVNYTSGAATQWNMERRLDLNFSVTVQADHGLTFGAFTRVRTNDEQAGTFNSFNAYVENSGLRLTFGNQAGAIEGFGVTGAAPIGYTGGTFAQFGGLYSADTGLNLYAHGPASTTAPISPSTTAPISSGNPQMIGLRYSAGDFTVAATHTRNGHTELAGSARFDAVTVAAGYANNAERYRTASVAYNAGDFTVGGIVTRFSGDNLYTLNGSVQFGGGTGGAYVGQHAGANVGGISYRYNLGGGAMIGAALERTAGGANRAELGVMFNF